MSRYATNLFQDEMTLLRRSQKVRQHLVWAAIASAIFSVLSGCTDSVSESAPARTSIPDIWAGYARDGFSEGGMVSWIAEPVDGVEITIDFSKAGVEGQSRIEYGFMYYHAFLENRKWALSVTEATEKAIYFTSDNGSSATDFSELAAEFLVNQAVGDRSDRLALFISDDRSSATLHYVSEESGRYEPFPHAVFARSRTRFAGHVNPKPPESLPTLESMSETDRAVFNSLIGTWAFEFPLDNSSRTYKFTQAGRLIESDSAGGQIGEAEFVVSNGELHLLWLSNGAKERAVVSDFDPYKKLVYHIKEHTDADQIGLQIEMFYRMELPPAPPPTRRQ